MSIPALRYPAGDVTPHGWWHITNDTRPMMRLRAYDGSVDFYLMGGYAPPFHDPTQPEAVALKSLKGLVPPTRHITQKGATQDGVTHVDALYEPVEVQAIVECIGRDPKHLRRVHRDLIASIDAKKQSELGWFTHDLGYWWAPVRWFQGAPPDPLGNPQTRRQQVSLRLSADDGFWRTYDDTASFAFDYESMFDTFDVDHSSTEDLGPNWPQFYSGIGLGHCSTTAPGLFGINFEQARWYEQGIGHREVVNGPYKDFHTDTDNQVATMWLGTFPQITLFGGAFNDLWGRMGRQPNGDWNGDGIRARVGINGIFGWIELARFNNFAKTTMRTRPLLVPPLLGERFTLVCGFEEDPRMFRILRNGLPIMSHKESDNGSALGSAHRGVGFGMQAGSGILSQAAPAWVRKIAAGDNATVSQSGFLKRVNVGDQPMYDDYTLFGPGRFKIWNGPNAGADEYVEFGPLLENQVAYIRTDPRKRGVEDLTSIPPTPQQLNIFQRALQQFINFATGNNVPPLLTEIQSLFGIAPPQGNLYSLLDGRFSDASAIPAKSPGKPAEPYFVKVEIDDGNADSKIIAAGTPLRRYPL